MTTTQTAPAAAPQAAAGAPNQYHLSGQGVHISYYPGGAGPVTPDGPIILTYQDSHQSKIFHGGQASVVAVAELGATVTVALNADIIGILGGSTTATLLIPAVVLGARESTTVHTELIITSHLPQLTNLGRPQRDQYTAITLTGQASAYPLPE